MYVRFPLSLRNVEDLLHERGIDISHETVRYWWNRFGPMFAAEIRRKRVQQMRAYSNWRWHLDEVFVKINGETHYLWRAVDHEGEVLESYVTKHRDRKAALKFLKTSMKRHGRPHILVTDKLRSYGAAMKVVGNADRQETGRWENNRAENAHPLPDSGLLANHERAVSTTRTRHAAVPQHAKFAEIRRRSCLRLQPFQPGARALHTRQFQAQPRRCSLRVAPNLFAIRSGIVQSQGLITSTCIARKGSMSLVATRHRSFASAIAAIIPASSPTALPALLAVAM